MKHHTMPSLYDDYEREVIIRLIKSKTPKEIAALLIPEMFTSFLYKKVLKLCVELIEKDGIIDLYQLTAQLKTEEQKRFLEETEKEKPVTANWRYFVKIASQRSIFCCNAKLI